jgi:hypothetical protein
MKFEKVLLFNHSEKEDKYASKKDNTNHLEELSIIDGFFD